MARTVSVILCAVLVGGCGMRPTAFKTEKVYVPVAGKCELPASVERPLVSRMPAFVGPEDGVACLTRQGIVEFENHYRELRAREAAWEALRK